MEKQNIKTIPFLTAVNLRYGMYAGTEPIPHVCKEIISNSLDEAKSGYGDKIIIKLNTATNTLSVRDFGRGIPADKMIDVLTKPHTGGKFDGGNTGAGLNGIGVKIATSLGTVTLHSYTGIKKFSVEDINKDNYDKVAVQEHSAAAEQGTEFIWTPSVDDRFDTTIKKEDIISLLESYVYCNSVTFELFIDDKKTIHKPKKLIELMPTTKYTEVFTSAAENSTTKVEIAMCWADESADHCFINGVRIDGGSHITLIRTALTRAINKFVENSKGEDIRRGLVLAIKVDTTEELFFSSQAKDKIAMPSLNPVVSEAFKTITDQLDEKNLKKVIGRLNRLNKALGLDKMKAEMRNKKVQNNKFHKSQVRDELIIVEGLSAAGGINLVKDHNTQATYALRGKLLNTWNKSLEEIQKNEEVQDLVKLLDEGYKKIILATDADADGDQIALLVIAFIHRFFPSYLEKGRVFLISLPSMMGKKNGKNVYFEGEAPSGTTHIEHFKGLGQVPAEALKQFITDPSSRSLTECNYTNISEEELEIAFDKNMAHLRADLLLEDYDQR